MLRKITRTLLPFLAAAIALSSIFSISAGASEYTLPFFGEGQPQENEQTSPDPYSETEPYSEPDPTSAPEPETFAPVWTEAPAPVETNPPAEPEEFVTESPRDEYAQLVDDAEEPTGINSVKMDKSVSSKTYSTDYTAGIVSWICVGVGLVVVLVMLVSTKLTGKRA